METTIRFGSACDRSTIATSHRTTIPEETDNKGDCDPDKLVQCPYDKNHQIRASRFPYHVIKCRKNHPKLAKELKTCPFNARHLVPKHELTHHIETCEDRIPFDTRNDETTNGHSKWQVPCSTWQNPNMTEDWDNEVNEDTTPFVWGTSTGLTPEKDLRPINDFGVRAPDSLPWRAFKP